MRLTNYLKRIKNQHSIARRLIIAIVLFSSLITLLTTALQLFREYDRELDLIYERISQVETSYLGSLTEHIWTFDLTQAQLMLEGILSLPNMHYLEIRSEDDVIVAAGDYTSGNIITAQFPLLREHNQQTMALGTLLVVASLDDIYQRLIDQVWIILTSNAIKTFLVSIFIFAIFQFMVTKHLERIAAFVSDLHPDALDQELQLERRRPRHSDELEQLVAAINTMRSQLHHTLAERSRAEAQAQRLQAELAHLGRRHIAGEMASGLAHELNQPLTAIVAYTQACLLRIRSGQAQPEELLKAMEQVAAQSQRAGEIIRRLRGLMRKNAPQRTLVDINALVKEAAGLMAIETSQWGDVLRLELGDSLPLVLADGIQIQQVVLNLLRNGLEAMHEAAAEQRILTVRTAPAGRDWVEVAVSDTGPGFSSEALARLFQPFFTTKSNGMGLGLSISRSIIEAHGGRLWATNNGAHGATFHFTLPAAGKHPQPGVTNDSPGK